MVYADEILDYSGQRKTGVTAGSYGPSADVSPEAGGTITVPQLTVNENGLITGAVERTVTLPSGGGGGGGGEEQFQKVYETTLTEAAKNIVITSENMGGMYVDVVWYISPETEDDGDLLNCLASFGSSACTLEIPDIWGSSYAFSVISKGGLLEASATSSEVFSSQTTYIPHGEIIPLGAGGGTYPDDEKAGILGIEIFTTGVNNTFLSGTTIAVYARRRVTSNAQA